MRIIKVDIFWHRKYGCSARMPNGKRATIGNDPEVVRPDQIWDAELIVNRKTPVIRLIRHIGEVERPQPPAKKSARWVLASEYGSRTRSWGESGDGYRPSGSSTTWGTVYFRVFLAAPYREIGPETLNRAEYERWERQVSLESALTAASEAIPPGVSTSLGESFAGIIGDLRQIDEWRTLGGGLNYWAETAGRMALRAEAVDSRGEWLAGQQAHWMAIAAKYIAVAHAARDERRAQRERIEAQEAAQAEAERAAAAEAAADRKAERRAERRAARTGGVADNKSAWSSSPAGATGDSPFAALAKLKSRQ